MIDLVNTSCWLLISLSDLCGSKYLLSVVNVWLTYSYMVLLCGGLCVLYLADNYIDGSVFLGLTLPEIREMVPPIGLAKKISNLMPKVSTWIQSYNLKCKFSIVGFFVDPVCVQQEANPSTSSQMLHSSVSPHPLSPGPMSPLSPTQQRDGSVRSLSTTPSRSDFEKVQIPEFWREDTQMCIEGVLDDESRSDICRTLVTLLVAKYGPKPGRVRCEELCRQLILKYPMI